MNYILKKVEVNGNADIYGGRDTETKIAISNDVDKLQAYCKERYGYEASVGKPQLFVWEYFMIVETEIIIL